MAPGTDPVTQRLDWLKWGLAAVGGGLCLAAIMAITVVTVFGRYVLHADLIPGGYNMIGSAFFPLLVFWGLPLAHRQGGFPRLDLLAAMLPRALARAVGVVVIAIECVVYGIVAYYCAAYALKAIETGRQLQIGSGYWPAWPVAVMAPVSFALLMAESARLVVADLRALLR